MVFTDFNWFENHCVENYSSLRKEQEEGINELNDQGATGNVLFNEQKQGAYINRKINPQHFPHSWVTWGFNDIAIPEQHWKTEDKWLVILNH